MKKILSLLLAISMIISATLGVSAEEFGGPKKDSINYETEINIIEQQNNKIMNQKLELYKDEYDKELKKLNKSKFEDLSKLQKEKVNSIKQKYVNQAVDEIDKRMKLLGFEEVLNESDEIQTLRDNPSDLILTDKLYFNSSKNQYNFVGYWNFNSWDALTSTLDIASVRMNNSSFPIVSSYAYSYDQAGKSTGTDSNGSHSTGSYVTKRFENKYGVAYNIKDTWVNLSSSGVYKTDSGRVSLWFKKGSGRNKIFFDFHHNYKTASIQLNATLAGVKLSGSSLNVSYSTSSKNYQRTSSGKSI
jgi:hypothetical protein